MRKEAVFAILSGIIIGLIFAFGAWKVSKIINKRSLEKSIATITPKTVKYSDLTLDDINNFDVINKNPYNLSGRTQPLSNVVISTVDTDYYLKSDKDGLFNIDINIPDGISELLVTDITNQKNAKFILVFSKDVDIDSISYIGTVTDISNNAIQLKSIDTGILQLSISSETKYINENKKGIEVKVTDLALGDYIVAIGNTNGNKVLKSKKIIITTPFAKNEYTPKEITIESLSKTKINDITLPKKWNGPDIKKLTVGDKIIVVGKLQENIYTLRSIFTTVE